MDKQQAAREFEKLCADNDIRPYSVEWSEAEYFWQAAQAALIPALVEARGALEKGVAYTFIAEQYQEETEFRDVAKKALARLNALLEGSKTPDTTNATRE